MFIPALLIHWKSVLPYHLLPRTSSRCAYDLAFGECNGIGPSEGIVRCDHCGTWSHVVCGGVAMGGRVKEMLHVPTATGLIASRGGASVEVGSMVRKEEHLCRGCARVSEPSSGSDPDPRVMEALNYGRDSRAKMLMFVEKDIATGCPYGVFDLNVRGRFSRVACVEVSPPFGWPREQMLDRFAGLVFLVS